MTRLPPRPTRPYAHFPYSSLFCSLSMILQRFVCQLLFFFLLPHVYVPCLVWPSLLFYGLLLLVVWLPPLLSVCVLHHRACVLQLGVLDRKSTRLNSSH